MRLLIDGLGKLSISDIVKGLIIMERGGYNYKMHYAVYTGYLRSHFRFKLITRRETLNEKSLGRRKIKTKVLGFYYQSYRASLAKVGH